MIIIHIEKCYMEIQWGNGNFQRDMGIFSIGNADRDNVKFGIGGVGRLYH